MYKEEPVEREPTDSIAGMMGMQSNCLIECHEIADLISSRLDNIVGRNRPPEPATKCAEGKQSEPDCMKAQAVVQTQRLQELFHKLNVLNNRMGDII